MPSKNTALSVDTSRTEALLRITQAIESAGTLDELLQLALTELTQLFQVAHGTVMLLRDQQSTANILSEYPQNTQTLPEQITLEKGSELLHATRQRRPLQLQRSAVPINERLLRDRDVSSVMIVPLIAQDQPLGLLLLYTVADVRLFNSDDLALARVLASQVAAAVAALRQSERAQRRNQELMTLNEIAATVTSTLDTHEVYRLVVQRLNTYFQVDAGSLFLLDDKNQDLMIVMTIEGGEEKLAGKRVPWGRGVVGYVVANAHWEIVHDAQQDSRFYAQISDDVGYLTRSILCVPMIAKGRVIGAIELLNKLDGPFTEEDADRLGRMAAFIGVAIENARLFQREADGRDRLAAILNSTADGIVMCDMDGRVLSANPMAAALFHADEAVLLGQSFDDLLKALHHSARSVTAPSWGVDEVDDDGLPPITEIELGGTQRRFIRHLTMPVRDTFGQLYARLAVFRDVTKEKELEQLRDDWTGMLVHDLRAPLTSIMNGIVMVQRGLSGPINDQQRELLGIAYQGSHALLELVNTLLDISRMQKGHMPLDIEPLVPYAIVDAAIERLRATASRQQVTVTQQLEVGLPLIEGDENKLVRVLQNLIDNAIKFSPTEAEVIVGVYHHKSAEPQSDSISLQLPSPQQESLVFWVKDQGPGIPESYHERIFEQFGQVQGHKVRGTGIGLTFCKLAVESHGGAIWVESVEGAGSTFAFTIPLARPEAGK